MKNVEAKITVLLLCFAVMTSVSALLYSGLGVKSGDWVKYDLQENFSLTGVQWQKMEFFGVAGTTVTIETMVHMSNGMEINQTDTVDIESNDDVPMALFGIRVYVVPPDLNIGDTIFLGALGNRTITGETTMVYAGANRRVVYSNFSQYESQYTFYWDKQTGVLMEGMTSLGSAFKIIWVTETNMWSGEFNWWFWFITAIIVVVIVIAFLRNRSAHKVLPGTVRGKVKQSVFISFSISRSRKHTIAKYFSKTL